MTDEKNQPAEEFDDQAAPDDESGTTTYDVSEDAAEALRMMREAQEKARSGAAADEDEKDVVRQTTYTDDTRLQLVVSSDMPKVTVHVIGEMIVGRGDNVTDYTPDIDFTPHGAYRLGLSRRHAIISRQGDQVVVTDLGSRNGTTINDARLDAQVPYPIKDGDLIQFGNLHATVRFITVDDRG